MVISAISIVIFNKKPGETPKGEIKVYYSRLIGQEIVIAPVTRKLPKGQEALSLALVELLKGPSKEEKDQGFYSEIPEGTRVIEIKEAPGEVRINLNKQFVYGGGANSVVARLKEMALTSLDAEPIRKVYLDVDGKELDMIGGEGLEVIQPLSRDNFPQQKYEVKESE